MAVDSQEMEEGLNLPFAVMIQYPKLILRER